MSLNDILGLVISMMIYILPFAVIVCFVLSFLYKRYANAKKTKTSNLLDKHCSNCMHRYLGADYLYHCDITEKMTPSICNPKEQLFYRRDDL